MVTQYWRAWTTIAVLLATLLLSEKTVDRYGDNFQIALPVLGLGCSFANGHPVDYAVRFVAGLSAVHATKWALGDTQINSRPGGGSNGLPSGHSFAAAFGASYLVHECVQSNPWVKGITILTAGFVGGARVQVGAHDIWQVMVGMTTGWLVERSFRKRSPLSWFRRRFPRLFGAK